MSLNKTQLLEIVVNETGLERKVAEKALNSVFIALTNELSEGGEISIIGFGTFSILNQPELLTTDPKTNKLVIIPEKKFIRLKAGKNLTEKLGLDA